MAPDESRPSPRRLIAMSSTYFFLYEFLVRLLTLSQRLYNVRPTGNTIDSATDSKHPTPLGKQHPGRKLLKMMKFKGHLREQCSSLTAPAAPQRPTRAGFTPPQQGTDAQSPMSIGSRKSQLPATLIQDQAPDFYVTTRAFQATVDQSQLIGHCRQDKP